MLRLICLPKSDLVIERESIHGAIHQMLPTQYHDNGVATAQNRDPLKSHTFACMVGQKIEEYTPFHLDIRGLPQIEESIYKHLKQNSVIKFKNAEVITTEVVVLDPNLRETFQTISPIIQRVSTYNPLAKQVEIRNGQKTVYFTALDDKEAWEKLLVERLYKKAVMFFGEESVPEPPCINIQNPQVVRPILRGRVMKGTKGIIKIIGDPFWQEFAYRIGLGERCPYGFGVLEVARR